LKQQTQNPIIFDSTYGLTFITGVTCIIHKIRNQRYQESEVSYETKNTLGWCRPSPWWKPCNFIP